MQRQRTIKDQDPNRRWTYDVNTRIRVVNDPPYRQIYIDYIMIAEYMTGSKFEEEAAIVMLIKNKAVSVPDLAAAFGMHHKTIYGYLSAYRVNGLEGLCPAAHYPGKVNNELVEFIRSEQRKTPHMTLTGLNRKLQRTYDLTLSESTVRKLVEAETILPLAREPDGQIHFDEILKEDRQAEDTQSAENNKGIETRYAGYLIFASLINELFSGIYEYIDGIGEGSEKTWEAKKLITSFALYFLMGLTNIEQTKTVNRRELGCLLEEESAPCSKTLKRNLPDLMENNLPRIVPDYLTWEYIEKGYAEMGQLYFDGHFVPYYGKEDIGSGFFTQRRLAVPGYEQFWANDLRGRPVFFLNSYGFSRFTQAIPELCKKAIAYMRQSEDIRPLLVAFDRGGYCRPLFRELTEMGVCWATWKAGETKYRPEEDFKETFSIGTGKQRCEYGVIFTKVRMSGDPEPVDAAIILNKKTKKQTTILYGVPEGARDFYQPVDLLKFLLCRWKQENFFKYALEEVDINQTHGLEKGTPDDAYYIPNPQYHALLAEKARLSAVLAKQEAKQEKIQKRYFTLKRKPSWESYLFQKGYQSVSCRMEQAEQRIKAIDSDLLKVPDRIPYTRKDGTPYTYLDFSKINLMNALKAAVFNMQCKMKDMAQDYFKDYRELSKFLDVLLHTGGTYEKGEQQDTVYLNPLETPSYQSAADKLVVRLNQSSPATLGKANKPLLISFK